MIYQIRHMRAKVRLEDDEMLGVLLHLESAGYTPAILRSRQDICQRIGLPETDIQSIRFRPRVGTFRQPRPITMGDAFFRDDAVFYLKQDASNLYMVLRDDGVLRGISEGLEVIEAGVIAVGAGHQRRLLAEFCKAVNNAIQAVCAPERLREFELSWKDDFAPHQKLNHLISKNKADLAEEFQMRFSEAGLPDQLFHAARLLVDTDIRDTLMFIRQTGKLLVADFNSSIGKRLPPKVLERLREHDLIHAECLVVCSKTGHELIRLKSRDVLSDPAIANLTSPFSGKRLSEERVEEILTLTDRAKHLLDGDMWLRLTVIEALERLGYGRASTMVNQSSDPLEIDLALQPFERLMFVKVKSGEFGLVDAYPFNFRCACYGAEVAVVVSTGGFSTEAEKVMRELSASDERGHRNYELHLLERLDDLPTRLHGVLSELSLHAMHYRLDALSSVAGLDFVKLVAGYLARHSRPADGQKIVLDPAASDADEPLASSVGASFEQVPGGPPAASPRAAPNPVAAQVRPPSRTGTPMQTLAPAVGPAVAAPRPNPQMNTARPRTPRPAGADQQPASEV